MFMSETDRTASEILPTTARQGLPGHGGHGLLTDLLTDDLLGRHPRQTLPRHCVLEQHGADVGPAWLIRWRGPETHAFCFSHVSRARAHVAVVSKDSVSTPLLN